MLTEFLLDSGFPCSLCRWHEHHSCSINLSVMLIIKALPAIPPFLCRTLSCVSILSTQRTDSGCLWPGNVQSVQGLCILGNILVISMCCHLAFHGLGLLYLHFWPEESISMWVLLDANADGIKLLRVYEKLRKWLSLQQEQNCSLLSLNHYVSLGKESPLKKHGGNYQYRGW